MRKSRVTFLQRLNDYGLLINGLKVLKNLNKNYY